MREVGWVLVEGLRYRSGGLWVMGYFLASCVSFGVLSWCRGFRRR